MCKRRNRKGRKQGKCQYSLAPLSRHTSFYVLCGFFIPLVMPHPVSPVSSCSQSMTLLLLPMLLFVHPPQTTFG